MEVNDICQRVRVEGSIDDVGRWSWDREQEV